MTMILKSQKITLAVLIVILGYSCKMQHEPTALYQSAAYTLTDSTVLQGEYTAKALSDTEIISGYQSPVNQFQSPVITFKFSINGKDNEMISGKDHLIHILPSKNNEFTSPLITFGEQYIDKSEIPEGTYLQPDTRFILRLDLRNVLKQFEDKGFYTTFNGNKIYKEDFKGVYVAGSASPLTWDFDNLVNHPKLELKDPDGDGIYEVTLLLNEQEERKETASSWKLSRDISAFPQYKSDYTLINALYNLALEEMENAIEPDSTFRTGKEWAGVWTRDISYSIILSMAVLQPKVAEYSLMRKVKNNRIIQDTGTGGSYPVSTDRMIWAVAAWEVYKVTGDKNWLTKVYPVIKNSVEDDLKNAYNPQTGLVKGESSFLDWREQTYPKWMQPVDIYESECLGTNAVHFQTHVVLAEMAQLLGDKSAAEKYSRMAEKIKEGINKQLWIEEKGYYGQFLYGRNYKILSPRSEALGEALSILFDIADQKQQKSIVENTPVVDFGIPCIYPQIPDTPPYHNNAVWPFVQSYWSLAAAKAGNEKALTTSMAAVYRPAALFLTNKENFVADNGDFASTQINSDNMLWSLAGNISQVYKILFGMDFQADGFVFKPFVPRAMKGKHVLTKFNYRKALLDIELEGYGNRIKSITLDGQSLENAKIPAGLKGKHSVKIILADNTEQNDEINSVQNYTAPAVPQVTYSPGTVSWKKVKDAEKYRVLKNGKEAAVTADTTFKTSNAAYAEYQVIAVDAKGIESFASEPVQVYPEKEAQLVELETLYPKAGYPYKGFSGNGFVEISRQKNTSLKFTVSIPQSGTYAIDFRYSNGNGPTNTENKCAIRTLKVGKTFLGTLVFPQRGKEEWSDWGFSNSVQVEFSKGNHTLSLDFEPWNENMNGEINQAMLDYVRIIRIK